MGPLRHGMRCLGPSVCVLLEALLFAACCVNTCMLQNPLIASIDVLSLASNALLFHQGLQHAECVLIKIGCKLTFFSYLYSWGA